MIVFDLMWFPFHEWPNMPFGALLPWYSKGHCTSGCCTFHTVTWLFFGARLAIVRST